MHRKALFAAVAASFLALSSPGADLAASRKSFLAARVAVTDGRFQEALELYRKALELIPEDAVVHLEYAQLLRDLNVLEQSEKEAREAVRLDPNLPEARRLLGSLALAAAEKDPSKLPEAVEQLSAARKLAPGDVATGVSLARALMAADRPAEAAAVLDDLPEMGNQPMIERLTADAKARSGRYKEAEAIYLRLAQADPGDREISAALIDLYEDQDKLDDAVAVLNQLEKRDPSNPAIAERIIIDLARAGRFTEAEARAQELVQRRPENRATKRLLATLLFETGRTEEGEKTLRDLAAADPDDPSSLRTLASELVRERRFAEARRIYEDLGKGAGADPRAEEARKSSAIELGFIAYLEKDWPTARRILAPVSLSNGVVNPRAARILLASDRDGEDFADGLQHARALAAADPSDPEWAATAAEFQHRSDPKAAVRKLDELAAAPDLDSMMAAADAYARLKNYDAAARIARDAAARFPESSEARFRLGSSLERAGHDTEAEKVFLDILADRPNDAATQNYLGYMWADRGVQLDRARDMLEKAVAREPRNAAYLDSLGWVYFRLGRMDSAEKNLREAARREPSDPTIEEHLGDLSMKRGDLAAAVRHWEKALDLKSEEPDRVREKLQRARSPVTQR